MRARSVVTYCRICPATCGLVLDVADTESGPVVTHVAGDEANPLSRGFTCTKGRHIADLTAAPNRYRSALRRNATGELEPVATQQAIDEIAARLHDVIATHGIDAIGLFTGTQAAMASLTLPFTLAFWRALGSSQKYSSMSVDQVAKWVTEGRLGQWSAGGQRLADSDVWMFLGTNPIVSMQGGYFTGFPIHDGLRRIDDEIRRGLRMVVVDPRRTELAARAEIHLQIVPGTDAALVAGLLRQMFADEHVDHDFVARWADGVDALRAAVDPFTPDAVGAVCGVEPDQVVRAARLFGEGRRGMATAGTGPDMGPHANLAEHLVQALNVVAGRYPRPGDRLAGASVLGSAKPIPAQVMPPQRSWDADVSPVSGFGPIHDEYPAVVLPAEIAAGRVRALICSGANPANAVPDSTRMATALSALDLLVTVDAFESATAELADFVIAPVVHLERPDTTRAYEGLMDRPFAQYTPAVLPAPPGTVDDWEFFLRLGQAMGLTLKVAGREYAPGDPVPTTDEVLASMSGRAQVPLDEVKQHPHGAIFESVEPARAAEPMPGASGRFDVAPADVVGELAALAATPANVLDGGLLLAVRRHKHVLNSLGTQIAPLTRLRANPCHVHPDDLARLGLADGAKVALRSDHGEVEAIVRADDTLRRGVVTIAHGFGGRDADGRPSGPNVNALLSATVDLQPLSAMPQLTAVPVTLTALALAAPTGDPERGSRRRA
jgi:anaerobic selenocysteine-containing dehydrogenase